MDYSRVPLAVPDPRIGMIRQPAFLAVGQFLTSPMVTVDPEARTRLKDVYLRYVDWCELQGQPRVSKVYFSLALALTGQVVYNILGSGRVRYLGLTLNP